MFGRKLMIRTDNRTLKERPIIMSTPMVKAILDGRKTMTRRVIKPQPTKTGYVQICLEDGRVSWPYLYTPARVGFKEKEMLCPYGQVGDRLWVRETFYIQEWLGKPLSELQPLHYKADGNTDSLEDYAAKPSIHMPRWASRITLEITEVRVERVQEITTKDAVNEGCPKGATIDLHDNLQAPAVIHWFANLWDSLNAKRGYGWDISPWVWVISFKPKKEK
uniref:ASCH domain-containing protein n=1 Tax=viral metagenome TaxID=1070528 RepID=A0A6M3LFQ3_9ZZZZ